MQILSSSFFCKEKFQTLIYIKQSLQRIKFLIILIRLKITLLYKDSFSPIKLSNISYENSFLTRIPFFQHVEKIVEKSMIKKKKSKGKERNKIKKVATFKLSSLYSPPLKNAAAF